MLSLPAVGFVCSWADGISTVKSRPSFGFWSRSASSLGSCVDADSTAVVSPLDTGAFARPCILYASASLSLVFELERPFIRVKLLFIFDFLRIRRSLSSSVRKRSSNTLRRTWTTNADTNMAEPMIMSKNNMNCWKVVRVDKFTVFRPLEEH